jgi:hypothetical protein
MTTSTYSPKCLVFHNIVFHVLLRGSSVSIVSGYGLDDREIEVRSPTKAIGFFL